MAHGIPSDRTMTTQGMSPIQVSVGRGDGDIAAATKWALGNADVRLALYPPLEGEGGV